MYPLLALPTAFLAFSAACLTSPAESAKSKAEMWNRPKSLPRPVPRCFSLACACRRHSGNQQCALLTSIGPFCQLWDLSSDLCSDSAAPKFRALVDSQQNCMGGRTFAVNSFAKSGALGSDWPAFLPIVPERPACLRRSIQKHQICITSLQALVTDASAFHLIELSNTPSDCLAA